MAFLADRDLTERARILIMDKLHSWRRHMGTDDIQRLFAEIEHIADDAAHPAALRACAVGAIATLLVVMREKNILARTQVEAYFPLLARLSQNTEEVPAVRGRAIKALGILGARESAPMMRTILADSGNVNEPHLSRNACLALARIEGSSAVEPIGKVLATTTEKDVFGTAAFALGQLPTTDSLAVLVQHKDRFPDSASPDAALANMESVILDVLREPGNSHALCAIEATRHLWKDGQRERFIPVLLAVAAVAPSEVKRAAVERLIEDARALPLEQEKKQLTAVLPIASVNPVLAECARHIQNRLSAKLLVPDAKEISTVERSILVEGAPLAAGNHSAQEYGDAVYRILNSISWMGYNYNHAGLFAGQSDGAKRCVEADTFTGDTTKNNSFSASFSDYGSDYYGAYHLSNKTLTFSERKAIMTTANEIADASIAYTYFSALDPITNDRPITISNIESRRCDGVVGYCYEVNGNQSWWQAGHSDRWNISQYPDEHNDAPDATVNPDTEESPWAQRGAPSSSSEGPGYDGPDPENACLTKPSTIKYPTFQISYSHVDPAIIEVTVKATDESGIAFITYRKPGPSAWITTPWQPMQPVSDSYSLAIQVTSPGTLYYNAQDNGGNIAGTAQGISFNAVS